MTEEMRPQCHIYAYTHVQMTVCVFVCLQEHGYVHIQMQVHILKHKHVGVHTMGDHSWVGQWVSLKSCLLFLFEAEPQCWDCKYMPIGLAFKMQVLRIELGSLCFRDKHLTD